MFTNLQNNDKNDKKDEQPIHKTRCHCAAQTVAMNEYACQFIQICCTHQLRKIGNFQELKQC